MPTAREIMTAKVTYCPDDTTAADAADIARAMPDAQIGDLVDAISSAPAN